jgi:hypothetical protein
MNEITEAVLMQHRVASYPGQTLANQTLTQICRIRGLNCVSAEGHARAQAAARSAVANTRANCGGLNDARS